MMKLIEKGIQLNSITLEDAFAGLLCVRTGKQASKQQFN